MNIQNRLARTPHAFKFTSKLFEFSLADAETYLEEKSLNTDINNKMTNGFSNFKACLDSYIDQLNDDISTDGGKAKIFGTVTLENGAIMRATSQFHSKPWFSNVSVRMDSDELFEYDSDRGICYGQVNF